MSTAVRPIMDLEGDADVLRLVRSPRLAKTIARLFSCVLVLVVIALAFVPWQQNSPAHGRVVAFAPLDRQQTVEAPVDGRVVHWHVREGDRVTEGAPLVARWHKRFARRLRDARPLSNAEYLEGFDCFDTEDFRIGYRAFLDKRKAAFTGR